jgi:hypothetical protein
MKKNQKTNKGLIKLKAINARAKKIREAGGSTAKTVKVVKCKIKQKDAIKQAARELRVHKTNKKTIR